VIDAAGIMRLVQTVEGSRGSMSADDATKRPGALANCRRARCAAPAARDDVPWIASRGSIAVYV